MAHRARRARAPDPPRGRVPRGVRPGGRPRQGGTHRRRAAGPDAHPLRRPADPAALPARHRVGHRVLVPGVLRAQRRLGPGQRLDQGSSRGRRVGHRRPEGVDLARTVVGLVLRRLSHRGGLAAPQGTVLPARPDGPAGHRDPPHPTDHGHRGVQRGVLRRCAHVGRALRRRTRRRLEGGHGHARVRARRAHPRPADGLRARAHRDHRHGTLPRTHLGPDHAPATRGGLVTPPDHALERHCEPCASTTTSRCRARR